MSDNPSNEEKTDPPIPPPVKVPRKQQGKRAASAPSGTPIFGTIVPVPPEDLAKYPKVNYIPGPGELDEHIEPDKDGKCHVILPNGTKMTFFHLQKVQREESDTK